MAVKKVSRKKLLKEPDEFISTTARVIHFVREHERRLTNLGIIAAVVIAVVAGGYTYLGWQKGKAQAAQQMGVQLYGEAFRKGDNPEGEKDNFRKALAKFQESLVFYRWGRVAQVTRIYMGNTYYALKDYDQAAASFSRSVDGPFASMALEGLGYTYEAKGDYTKALDFYQKNTTELSPYREEAMLATGRCYEALNQKSKALEMYQNALAKYPKSKTTDFLQWKIGELKG